MESIFSVVVVLMALLFYMANHSSPINRWCAIHWGIASIGVIKEAFLVQAIPFIQSVWGDVIREDVYIGVYSVMTWISYSFVIPAAFITGLYFYGLNNQNPKLLSVLQKIVWIPAVTLSFFYHPVLFRAYQLADHTFWTVYSVYNLSFGAASIVLVLIGIRTEKSKLVKRQKVILGSIILPASVYLLVSIYVVHWLGLERWFKAWQWNAAIIFIGLVTAVVMTFKNGFIGLKLSAQVYEWDSDMDATGKGANYTSHMLKTQTSKMELCIEQLKAQHGEGDLPEELNILSRTVSTVKNYVDRMKRHSQTIRLAEEPCSLSDMIKDATPAFLTGNSGIAVRSHIGGHVYIFCDKTHITEVLSNIITNAAEAIRESGTIDITGSYEKAAYRLCITDSGAGINGDDLDKIFTPYFTTKSTEKNFGLGLSYCKNVITKHGGSISAVSKPGKGTTVTITYPSKKVAMTGGETDA